MDSVGSFHSGSGLVVDRRVCDPWVPGSIPVGTHLEFRIDSVDSVDR